MQKEYLLNGAVSVAKHLLPCGQNHAHCDVMAKDRGSEAWRRRKKQSIEYEDHVIFQDE